MSDHEPDREAEVKAVLDQIHALIAPFPPVAAAMILMTVFAATMAKAETEDAADEIIDRVTDLLGRIGRMRP
jgi:hypothetical protein